MPIRHALLAFCVISATLIGRTALGNEPAAEPEAVIEALHAVLLDVMKSADTLGVQGRYERLSPPITDSFNLPLMARISAGRHWSKADANTKTKFVETFTRLSIATYAANFSGHSGERFETLGIKDGPQNTRLVETQIHRPEPDGAVALTYVMRKDGDSWRIVDVLLDGGISELAVRRSEYNTVLNGGGMDALIKTLTEKADQLVGEDRS